MSSSYSPPSSSMTHRIRTTSQTAEDHDNSNNSDRHTSFAGPRQQNLAPSPKPRAGFQLLAFAAVILLGLLQFLPATHFRDPVDPFRNWVPVNSNTSSPLIKSRASSHGGSGFINGNSEDDGMVHVVSWMDCLDLRVLAVLINSTLSSSSYPDLVFFHFFIPGGNEDKLSYYKLKVLFPHSNLEILGQEEVKGTIRASFSGMQDAKLNYQEIVPFIIPNVHQLWNRFIYLSPIVIMKGRVEELTGVDLTSYAVAVAEDCSETLSAYVDSVVLDAIQRAASKPWVSETPYITDACLPDLSLVSINARNLGKDFLEALLWWRKVLNLNERTSQKDPAIALALYNRYLKLSPSWLVKESLLSEAKLSKAIHYDGPMTICDASSSSTTSQVRHGNVWSHCLPSNWERILGS
ncbi:hypothetical protein Tsubulata_028799 [Turnera subulata]|uniref:Hexosyltransferase n=1 Tax=Turnera subulata TaxID=218843 RepID=A0A9Q0G586_9ROSI|nr:hypothetical protein Tsubulata_028799 [Turnera subulata]